MPFRTPLQAMIAVFKADASIAAVVGANVFGTLAFQTPPPFIVVELFGTDFGFRTGTDTLKTRLETTTFLVKCNGKTSDAADVLARLAAEVLDDLDSNALFDVTGQALTDSLPGDYKLGVDKERAPDVTPVYVGTIAHHIKMTVTKLRP